MNLIKATMYAVVRRADDDGHEWLDTSSLDMLISGTKRRAQETDERIPNWAAANPVIRITTVIVEEDPDCGEIA